MASSSTKIWKVVAFFFGSSTALLLAFAWWLPRTYYVSRSMVIGADAKSVMATVGDLHSWPKWTVWLHELDPSVEVHFGDTPEGPELRYLGKKLGRGRFVVIEDKSPAEITVRAEMTDTGSAGLHRFQIEEDESGTRLVWSMMGDAGDSFLSSLTVGTRERLAVRDFDQSLTSLKTCIEQGRCP